ncbi:hypothetical protein MFLO_02538 [Listeria floridensis FSL S10-1187]|uniref:Thioredoxin domain-containing protein n=1 Tax=Listeria floridensis FSL S10-1187 TaxID=1265817 RepID=A0ABP3B1Y9_9LIST|nr:hypothetical protein [Listeria floridensis]EUJ33537.1 hypothetical protein MFLO_02538 [Listeria floridensis FSL S10-1187]
MITTKELLLLNETCSKVQFSRFACDLQEAIEFTSIIGLPSFVEFKNEENGTVAKWLESQKGNVSAIGFLKDGDEIDRELAENSNSESDC